MALGTYQQCHGGTMDEIQFIS